MYESQNANAARTQGCGSLRGLVVGLSVSLAVASCGFGLDTGAAASKIESTIEELKFDAPDEISIFRCPVDPDDVVLPSAVASLASPQVQELLQVAPDSFAYIHDAPAVPPGVGCSHYGTVQQFPKVAMTVGLAPADVDAYVEAILDSGRRVVSSSSRKHKGGTLGQYVVGGGTDTERSSAYAIWFDKNVHVTLYVDIDTPPETASMLADGLAAGLADVLVDVVDNLNDWRLATRGA